LSDKFLDSGGFLIVTTVLSLLKITAVLVAAILIGNWYQSELKKVRAKGKPWYKLYLSLPGIIIILVILLPVFLWLLK
jgi:hypothetical protein